VENKKKYLLNVSHVMFWNLELKYAGFFAGGKAAEAWRCPPTNI
jgi:hypothetical protein